MEYTHFVPGNEVRAVGGAYQIESESRLDYAGKKVLYLIESTSPLNACGEGACRIVDGISFICVPGFVKRWQFRSGEGGVPVSDVEPVADEGARMEIRALLAAERGIDNIDFW